MSRVGRKVIPIPKGVKVQVKARPPGGPGAQGQADDAGAGGHHLQAGERRAAGLARRTTSGSSAPCTGSRAPWPTTPSAASPRASPRSSTSSGVGYKANVEGQKVVFALGYSHPVVYPIPAGIKVAVDAKANRVTVSGIDRQQVGQVAAEIRSLRKPDPYKQKGIRYVGEVLKKKAGKAGATGAK